MRDIGISSVPFGNFQCSTFGEIDMSQATRQLLERYYAAFNAGDWNAFLGMLTEDVAHDVNQGAREVGRAAFAKFMERMNTSYSEQIADIVIMSSADGAR